MYENWISTTKDYELEDLWGEDKEKLNSMLCRFVLEARLANGKHYTPNTLLQLLTNLQTLAYEKNESALHFMNHKDVTFKQLHNVTNNVSKQLLADGIGAEKKQARVITEEEEGILWEKKVLGCHSPTSLLHTIFYFCGMYFCLRGGAKHRELKLSQLEVQVSSNGVKCLVYREHGSKNHQGLTHQVHLNNKIVHHYADNSLGDRCFVHLFELYVSKLPAAAKERDLFYCKPKVKFSNDDEEWYYNAPIGRNILASLLKEICSSAGLDCSNIQNHSLRANSISRMYSHGVPEKQMMERSGHQSLGGLRSYERTAEHKNKKFPEFYLTVSLAVRKGNYQPKHKMFLGLFQPLIVGRTSKFLCLLIQL